MLTQPWPATDNSLNYLLGSSQSSRLIAWTLLLTKLFRDTLWTIQQIP